MLPFCGMLIVWTLLLMLISINSLQVIPKLSLNQVVVRNYGDRIIPTAPAALTNIRGGETKYKKSVSTSKRARSIASLINGFVNKIKAIFFPKLTKSRYVVKDTSINRIQKEMKDFLDHPPANCKLTSVNKSNIRKWIVSMTGVEGTVYAGEKFKLCLEFSKQYPAKPPSVYFLKPAPKHIHCYTNGDICLSILGKDWQPTMTAQSIVVSILSMLSSAKAKGLPPDNSYSADITPGQPREYMYHDDRC